jgi:tetratricopeptide (TPR) repeat protein
MRFLLKHFTKPRIIYYTQKMTDSNENDGSPTNSMAWVKEAIDLQTQMRYREAITAYSKAIKLDPELPDLYCMRGFAYTKLELDKLALKDYNKAITLDPKRPETYYMRGSLYARQGDIKKAIKDLTTSLTLDPQQAAVYGMRGAVHVRAKETMLKGIEDFKTGARMGHEGCCEYLRRRGIGWGE